jgi:hypothetical protein
VGASHGLLTGQLASIITHSVRWSTGRQPVCITPGQLASSNAGTPELLNVFEALYEAIESAAESAHSFAMRNAPSLYEARLNEALEAHRVAYKMINGQMMPF